MGGGSGRVTSAKALGSMPSRDRLALPRQLAFAKVLLSIESGEAKSTAQATPWPMRFQEFRGAVISVSAGMSDERLKRNPIAAFLDQIELVGLDILERLFQAVGPPHF